MTPTTAKALPGVLHHYAPRLTAFEHGTLDSSPGNAQGAKNYVLWLGGLFDGLRTVDYPLSLHNALNTSNPTSAPWVVVEVLLTSSYTGWQTSSLESDAAEVAQCVAYFRTLQVDKPASKIVLMGHSTGCQIATHYLIGPWRSPVIPESTLSSPKVDGVVLQAGISDREAVTTIGAEAGQGLQSAILQARNLLAAGEPETRLRGIEAVLPGAPTARRFLSLVSDVPAEADDDYFSSDLDTAHLRRVWGKEGLAGRGIRIMVCLSGADSYMPVSVDKNALVGGWGAAVKEAGGLWDERSGPVAGASHNLNGNHEAIVSDLCKRVVGFVGDLY